MSQLESAVDYNRVVAFFYNKCWLAKIKQEWVIGYALENFPEKLHPGCCLHVDSESDSFYWVMGTDKENIRVEKIRLYCQVQAGGVVKKDTLFMPFPVHFYRNVGFYDCLQSYDESLATTQLDEQRWNALRECVSIKNRMEGPS